MGQGAAALARQRAPAATLRLPARSTSKAGILLNGKRD
jgi:hypothetical protein